MQTDKHTHTQTNTHIRKQTNTHMQTDKHTHNYANRQTYNANRRTYICRARTSVLQEWLPLVSLGAAAIISLPRKAAEQCGDYQCQQDEDDQASYHRESDSEAFLASLVRVEFLFSIYK